MLTFLRTAIQAHTPPWITLIISIAIGVFYLGKVCTEGFETVSAKVVNEARQPTYAMLYSSLEKQVEKLDTDPDDIKTADIKLLYNQCNSDFGNVYIASLSPSEKGLAKQTCGKLESIYLSRY